MRYEIGLHRFVLGVFVALLAAFVACLVYLNAHADREHLEAVFSLIVVLVAATMFGFMGMFEGMTAFYFGLKHKREVLAYLGISILSALSALYLVISPEVSLQMVALVAAPQALLFGLAEIRMSRHLDRHPRQRRALGVCGVLELVLGLALVWAFTLPSSEVAELLGGVAFLTLIQMLSLLLFREVPEEHRFVAR